MTVETTPIAVAVAFMVAVAVTAVRTTIVIDQGIVMTGSAGMAV